VYGTEKNTTLDCNDTSQIVDRYVLSKNNNRLSFRIPITKLEGKANFAFTFIDFYGNESKEILSQLPLAVLNKH
jgi:hypothetical protein